jgi:hypothetical protein
MKRYWTTEQLQDYVAQQRQQAESRGVTYTKLDLGPGPAADYGKGPGSWTGD